MRKAKPVKYVEVSVWSGEQPPTIVHDATGTLVAEGAYHVYTNTEIFRFPLARILLITETRAK